MAGSTAGSMNRIGNSIQRELSAFERNTGYTTGGRGCGRRSSLQTSNRGSSTQSGFYSASQSTTQSYQSIEDDLIGVTGGENSGGSKAPPQFSAVIFNRL